MHIHNVYFWLKEGLNEDDLVDFESGLALLSNALDVQSYQYGKPADTDRDVIVNSYSYGLVLFFADKAAHDRYQESPEHLSFLDMNQDKWIKVVVYDIEN